MPSATQFITWLVTLAISMTKSQPLIRPPQGNQPSMPSLISKVIADSSSRLTINDVIMREGSHYWTFFFCGDKADDAQRSWYYDPRHPRNSTIKCDENAVVPWQSWCKHGKQYVKLSSNKSVLKLRQALKSHSGNYTCLWRNATISSASDSTAVEASNVHRYQYNVVVCPQEPVLDAKETPNSCVANHQEKTLNFDVQLKKLVIEKRKDLEPIEWMLKDGLMLELYVCEDDSEASTKSAESHSSSASSSPSPSPATPTSCRLFKVQRPPLIDVDECHFRIRANFSDLIIEERMKSVRLDFVAFCSEDADHDCGRTSEDKHKNKKEGWPNERRFVVESVPLTLIRYSMSGKECQHIPASFYVGVSLGSIALVVVFVIGFLLTQLLAPFAIRLYRDKIRPLLHGTEGAGSG